MIPERLESAPTPIDRAMALTVEDGQEMADAAEKSGKLLWNKATLRWSKLEPQEKKWWWKTSTGMSFAWIPMDYMP